MGNGNGKFIDNEKVMTKIKLKVSGKQSYQQNILNKYYKALLQRANIRNQWSDFILFLLIYVVNLGIFSRIFHLSIE